MGKQPYNRVYTEEKWRQVPQESKDILADFIQEMKSKKRSEGTIKQYYNDGRIFLCWAAEHKPRKTILDMKKRDFRDYVLWCTDEYKWSNQRVNRTLSMIHMWTQFLEDDEDQYEDYERSASEKVRGLQKEPVRDIVFLEDAVILKVVDNLIEMKDYRRALLVALFYDTGSRKAEVQQIQKESFYDETKTVANKVRAKRGKIYRPIYHSLSKKCAKLYLEQRGQDDNPALFLNSEGRTATVENIYEWIVSLRPMFEEITGKECSLNPHSLRHAFIQNLSDGTHYLCREQNLGKVPLDKIKILCNHSDLSTTDSYRKDTSLEEIGELFNIDMEE